MKRKNFTPASRDTNSEREDDADAEVGEEEEEDHVRTGRSSWTGRTSGLPDRYLPFLPTDLTYRSRLLISAQFTTFHQASM